ncbi:MAG: hypothetical protein LBN21_02190 [Treponema sp.]|jgi:hypothetical protein|nr:hypothetical protein [Treponema sp.]
MDIYSFLNSPDVDAHCRKIEKVWNPLEMAIIVHMSHRPLREKHAAYREILSDYDDMLLPQCSHHRHDGKQQFKQYLREYLAHEERNIEYFHKPDFGAVYMLRIEEKGSSGQGNWRNGLYSSLEKVMAYVQETYEPSEVYRIFIDRQMVDGDESIEFMVSYDGELLEIWNPLDFDGALKAACGFLDNYYIDIPAPFQKGDILTYVDRNTREGEEEIFVLEYMYCNNPELHQRYLTNDFCGDISDMNAAGYALANSLGSGLVFDTIMLATDLQYYKGSLKGKRKILKYVSLFLRDEIKIDLLTALQNKILLESFIELCGENLAWYNLKYFEEYSLDVEKNHVTICHSRA